MFNVSSIQYCEGCGLDINIGTGGEYNWNGLLASTDHIHNARKKLAPTKRLTSFFIKVPGIVICESPDAGPSSHLAEPACLSSALSTHPIPNPGLCSVVHDGVDQSDKEFESTQLGPFIGNHYHGC